MGGGAFCLWVGAVVTVRRRSTLVDVPHHCHLPCQVAYEEERCGGLLTWTLRHHLDDMAHTVGVPHCRYHKQLIQCCACPAVGR